MKRQATGLMATIRRIRRNLPWNRAVAQARAFALTAQTAANIAEEAAVIAAIPQG